MNKLLLDQYKILNTLTSGAMIVDSNYTAIFWNKCLQKWTHLKNEDILNKNIFDLFPKLSEKKIKIRLTQIFENGAPIILSAQLHKSIIPSHFPNGKKRVQNISITSIPSPDEPNRFYALFSIQDVSDVYHLKEKADYANKMKSQFLTNISHELRTPMNSILGFSEILMSNEDSSVAELSSYISQSGNRLLKLINNILDLSKIEAGKNDIELHTFELSKLLLLQDHITVLNRQKNLEISFVLDDDLPKYIYSDENVIIQILINFVSNAIKFTENGHVRIKISHDKIESKIIFTVSDTGIGLKENDLENVFEEFYQVDGETQKEKGTGLGLSICKQLVRSLSGQIWAESRIGIGSTFSFSLSSNIPELNKSDSINSVTNFNLNENTEHSSYILIAEDEKLNQTLMKHLLNNYTISIVENGKEALEKCNTKHPDIIFLDIKMPILDGKSAMKQLKSNSNLSHIPVIALTALAMKGEEESLLEAGFDGYLSKPINKNELIAIIHHHLN